MGPLLPSDAEPEVLSGKDMSKVSLCVSSRAGTQPGFVVQDLYSFCSTTVLLPLCKKVFTACLLSIRSWVGAGDVAEHHPSGSSRYSMLQCESKALHIRATRRFLGSASRGSDSVEDIPSQES